MLHYPRVIDYIVLAIFILVVAGIVAVCVWQWPLLRQMFTDPDRLRVLVDSFGARAPLVYIGIYTVMVVGAILPAYVLNFVSGAMFGFAEGIAYTWIGTILGAAVVIVLMRRVALSVMRIFIPNKKIERFTNYVHKYGWFYLFLLYLIPNPLGDLLNYVSAASRLQIHKLLLMVAVGRIPGIILQTALGSSLGDLKLWHWVVLIATYVAIIAALYVFRKPINSFSGRISVKLFPPPEPEKGKLKRLPAYCWGDFSRPFMRRPRRRSG